MVEQGPESEKEQQTCLISSFPEYDKILVWKAEMESCNEKEKELLVRVVKVIRCDLEMISPNLRYVDRSVRAATVKINKIVSLMKTETITETISVLRAAGNIVAEIVYYKNKEITGNKKPNWQRRILEKQRALRKDL